jgi:hypothetical protein
MHSARTILVWFAVTAAAAMTGGCSGSTSESTNPPGGGSIVDSALPEAEPEAAAEADEASVDADHPDVEQADASVDQSVEETSAPDGQVSDGSLFDLTMPDVALNDAGATIQTCYDCAAVQCNQEMSSCEQDDACRTLVLCLFTEGCIDGSGMGGVNTSCAFGCLQQSGITSYTDPAVQIALNVASCVNKECQPECALPDGGVIPPDSGI